MLNRKQERALSREWKREFERVKRATASSAGPAARIDSIDVWENVGDRTLDCIVVDRIFEHLPDIEGAFIDLKKHARKLVIFCIELDAGRGADYWRKMIEKEMPVVLNQKVDFGNTSLLIIHAMVTTLNVEGVVAANSPDRDWEQIVENCSRISQRLQRRPVHGRKVVLACYGPSIEDTFEILEQEAREPNTDVVSVSGAHDYIITKGLMPRYHVECDPRPHKAHNIAKAVDGVRYLMASHVSPKLIDKLSGGDIVIWHASSHNNLRIINELESDAWCAGAGSNVGLRAITLFYELGYREFSIYGMDCSVKAADFQWAGPHAKKDDHKEHVIGEIEVDGVKYLTTKVLAQYVGSFFDVKRWYPDVTYRMYGDGLLQAAFRKYALTPFNTITKEVA